MMVIVKRERIQGILEALSQRECPPTRVNHEARHPGIGNSSCSSGTRQRTNATDTYVNLEVENTLDYCISRVVGTYRCNLLR
jgi:hypothetical protein